jgi:hypothetical protein
MEWYDWFFLMSAASCAVAATGIVTGVYILIRERGPDGEERRRRRLGY